MQSINGYFCKFCRNAKYKRVLLQHQQGCGVEQSFMGLLGNIANKKGGVPLWIRPLSLRRTYNQVFKFSSLIFRLNINGISCIQVLSKLIINRNLDCYCNILGYTCRICYNQCTIYDLEQTK